MKPNKYTLAHRDGRIILAFHSWTDERGWFAASLLDMKHDERREHITGPHDTERRALVVLILEFVVHIKQFAEGHDQREPQKLLRILRQFKDDVCAPQAEELDLL